MQIPPMHDHCIGVEPLPPVLAPPISSLTLVTIKSTVAFPLLQLSIPWLKKLSPMHSKSLLDYLQLAMLLFAGIGVVEVPQHDKSL